MASSPRSSSASFRHWLEYLLFRGVVALVRLLPWSFALAFGAALGRLLHLLDPRHRRITRDNLRQADLGLQEEEIRATARRCFEHFGALLVSMLRMLHMKPAEILTKVRLRGMEHFDAARAEGRGFIVLTGHYGNWELLALALSIQGRSMAVIGRELDNPLLDPYLARLRGRFGNAVVPKRGALRESLTLLKKGAAIGFLLDQDALTTGVYVRFLGRWASTHATAATLALRHNLPVVPLFSRPGPDGILEIEIHPPFLLEQTGDRARDTWVATQRMTSIIENEIRKAPAYWFWMHRRFKTCPGPGDLPPESWQA